MKALKQQIPNLFTLGNLFCGCLAIKFAFEWDLVMAAYLVGLGAFLDFFDGFLARILKVQGELGKQLDSLADMVTFGVVPGVVMFQMMRVVSLEIQGDEIVGLWGLSKLTTIHDINDYVHPFCYIAFLIPILSGYRLAKFNLDTRQSDKFIGLPTPANAIFICSIGIIVNEHLGIPVVEASNFYNLFNVFHLLPQKTEVFTFYEYHEDLSTIKNEAHYFSYYVSRNNFFIGLISITGLFSYLLISELPLFALKFKSFGFKGNEIRYIFLGISAVMLIIFQLIAIPFIVLLYLLMSVINNLTLKQ